MWKKKKTKYPLTHKWIIKVIHPYSECESEICSVVSNSLRPHGLYSPWYSPGQNTGVSNLSLLQGILPTQGLNPGLPHCRWILLPAEKQGKPKILEWVAFPFSGEFSDPGIKPGSPELKVDIHIVEYYSAL